MELSTTQIIIFIGMGLMVLTVIGIVFLELARFKRKSVKAHFIYKDQTIKKKRYKNIKDSIEFDDYKYNYDEKATFFIGRHKNIFFVYGNPTPVVLGLKNNEQFTAEDFKNMARSDTIEKLFSSGSSLTQANKLFLGILIAGFLVMIFLMWKFTTQPVILSSEGANAVAQAVVDIMVG